MVQLEEAYARATVAITRARALCLIMGPLDMKGLLGAATVMGTLMYGAGHVSHFYLHDHELSRSPPDESFIDMLKQNCCLSGPHFPPPAIVEVLEDYVTNYHKVRRLHLIVVDLWRPWKYNTARAREITDQLWRIRNCDDTRRVSPFRPDGPEPPLRCRRFAYGYALDGSEFPCFLVWPQRDGQSYILLDTSTADTLVLDQSFFRPLGMQHFYDSFALVSQVCVRRDALTLFGLNDDELLPDLHITGAGVLRTGLGAHQEHRVNHDAQAADRTKVPAEVIQVAAHEVDTTTEPSPPQSTSSVSAFMQAIPPLADSEIPSAASDIPMESPRNTTTPMAVDPNPVPPSTDPVDPTTSGGAPSRPSTPRPITSTTKDRPVAPLILPPRPPPNTFRWTGLYPSRTVMLAFLPGFPLFLKFMKRPITALKRYINFIFAPAQPLDVPPLCSRVACRTRFWALLTPPVKLSPLLNYLHQHLTPHLRPHIGTSIQSCFVTLVIGPSTDSRVGAALHSHLVCAAVAPSNEDYSVLFIPSDLLSDFICPIEWQPLFLYLAASLCYTTAVPTYCWLPPTHSFLPISSCISPLTLHYPRTRWILARPPPVSIPFAFAPRMKLVYLCNPHFRINSPMLPPAALPLRR